MPMYEYKCDVCGQVFEVIQRFSDEPLTTHEACGGAVRRLISAPAFQFKGSGWYITDYAKGGNASTEGAKTGSETSASEAKSDGAKSDGAKPDSPKAGPAPASSTSSSADTKKT